jgi:hypothetical protein
MPLLLLLPLPSPLPFAFDPSTPLVLPCSQFLIDNFSKTRAIRNLIQLTQNNHHHQILIDNFNDPLPLQLILATTGNPPASGQELSSSPSTSPATEPPSRSSNLRSVLYSREIRPQNAATLQQVKLHD